MRQCAEVEQGKGVRLSIHNVLLRNITFRVNLGPERACLPAGTADPVCAVGGDETGALGSLLVQVFADGSEVPRPDLTSCFDQ